MKRIPTDIFDRYFSPVDEPGYFEISESIRRAVTFQQHNLTSLNTPKGDFGLIVCKNVLLHLTPQERIDVIRMFHGALSPDGYLATEQTQKIPDELQGLFRQVTPDAQVFQKI